jgi:hypothetical protein
MGTHRETTSASGWTVAVVLLSLLLLFVLYVLGAGPMAWLVAHGYISGDLAGLFYLPVACVIETTDWFDRYWWAYLDLWRP